MDYGKTRELTTQDTTKMLLEQLKTSKNKKIIGGLISKLNKLKKSIYYVRLVESNLITAVINLMS